MDFCKEKLSSVFKLLLYISTFPHFVLLYYHYSVSTNVPPRVCDSPIIGLYLDGSGTSSRILTCVLTLFIILTTHITILSFSHLLLHTEQARILHLSLSLSEDR